MKTDRNNVCCTAIVLSAGTGSRMKSDIPKQYMKIGEYPVIYYALKAFENSRVDHIVLVTGKEDVDYCRHEIVEKYRFQKISRIVPGGEERYLSVYEGLKAAEKNGYVLIHDAARPVIDEKMVNDCIEAVVKEKACIPAVPVKDTIKISDGNGCIQNTPDRSFMFAAQTPQCFEYGLIMDGYRKLFTDKNIQRGITDDAMLVERMTGHKIWLIPGRYENIKITTPEDLQIAGLFLQNNVTRCDPDC